MTYQLNSSSTERIQPPTRFTVAVGLLVALWCAVFAAISIWFEATDYFSTGPYATDAVALSVVNWYVAAVKLVGVAVAVLAIIQPPRFLGRRLVSTLLWAAFATTAVYVAGSLAQAVAMVAAQGGGVAGLSVASGIYVLAFLFAAVGFGLLALSYRRRAGLGKREIIGGAFGAPLVLGSILIVLPELLRAVGLLSR